MAFVPIDNPAGIQHHGGQMDWCRISPTRIAVLTFTVDNRALVQEVNFNAGATELGPASFLKQVTPRLPAPQVTYFKPRIKSMGNDKLFIMVPASFFVLTNSAAEQRVYGTVEQPSLNPTTDVPYTHTCMIAIRNGDGTYTVDSSIDVRTQNILEGGAYKTLNTPIDIDINPNGLQVLINQPVLRTSGGLGNRLILVSTLTLTAGKLTGQSVAVVAVPSITQNTGIMSLASREVLTPQLVAKKIFAYSHAVANPATWIGVQNTSNGAICTNYLDSDTVKLWPATNINGNYLNLNAYLPIDTNDKFLYTGGLQVTLGGNCYLNNNLLAAGAQIINPLDSAWVTDSVACTIGMAGSVNVGENPVSYPTPVLDGDVAYSLNPTYSANNYVRRLSVAFKYIVGAGLYIGPFDPIVTPYYVKDFFNFGPMIHRINDTAFWIIGCFMDGPTGAQQLGVITVKT